jgi:ribose 5-phosphate isomerase RpiB
MKVAIVENKVVQEYFSILLKSFDCKIYYFSNVKELNEEFDFIFFSQKESIFVKGFKVFLSFSNDIYDKCDYVMPKNISPELFKKVFPILVKLKKYIDEQSFLIEYKESQEFIAIKKQLKFMKNPLSMYYDKNHHLIQSYFKPKDILSGDSIVSKKISDNEYFFGIIDAMGKGIGASLTATNLSSYLYYLLNSFDFDFRYLVNEFLKYAKSSLLEDEVLCFIGVYVKGNVLYIVNFGMPPIYVDRKKIIANNLPISINSDNFNVISVEFKNDFILFSDGLIESSLKEGGVYFSRFKNLLYEFNFLNEIIKDFNKNAIQEDDISIVFFRKDFDDLKEIFYKSYKVSFENIDYIINEIDQIIVNDKLVFVLHELLLNSYEHVAISVKNKEQFLKKGKKIYKEKVDVKVFIKILENNKYLVLHYCDSGEGFDISKLIDLEDRRFHARGIKMIRKMSEGIFFNEKGNCVKIYLKKEK